MKTFPIAATSVSTEHACKRESAHDDFRDALDVHIATCQTVNLVPNAERPITIELLGVTHDGVVTIRTSK
jgi:hypothetical protein